MLDNIKRYLEEGRIFYGIIGSLILINLVVQFVLVEGKKSAADDFRKEYFSLRKNIVKTHEEMKSFESEISLLQAMREDINEFLSHLPERKDMTKIIRQLHKEASKSGLKISSSNYSQSSEKDFGLIKYTVSFPVTGSYRQIRKFIYNLENLPYLMSIDDITIKSKDNSIVSLPVQISIYFKADEL